MRLLALARSRSPWMLQASGEGRAVEASNAGPVPELEKTSGGAGWSRERCARLAQFKGWRAHACQLRGKTAALGPQELRLQFLAFEFRPGAVRVRSSREKGHALCLQALSKKQGRCREGLTTVRLGLMAET